MSDQVQKDTQPEGVKPDPNLEKNNNEDPLNALNSLPEDLRKKFEEVHGGLVSALKSEREVAKEAKKRVDAIEKASQEAEKKRLEEAQDFKKLYEKAESELMELRPKAETFTSYETILKKTLESSIAEIPEEKRSLIPSKLSIQDQLEWISENRALLSKAQPFDIGAGKHGGAAQETIELTPEELAAAKRLGIKPEDYAKNL